MEERRWKIGELARATGLTVRTLHHYDELGLLEPSQRTAAGHRLYAPADVERLYRIVALRRLGLSLEAIGTALGDAEPDLSGLVRGQLAQLDRELAAAERLRRRLQTVIGVLDREGEPAVDTLIDAMEATAMFETHYTPEQLAQLGERRDALGEAGMAKAQQDWAELLAAVEAERERGTDPADPRMQQLAGRYREMIDAFTGGDAGTERSLATMYREEGAAAASRGMVDEGLMAYVGEAMAIRSGRASE